MGERTAAGTFPNSSSDSFVGFLLPGTFIHSIKVPIIQLDDSKNYLLFILNTFTNIKNCLWLIFDRD